MLEKMLKYQSEEILKISLENELDKSSDKENASKIQKILKSQHSELVKLENKAKELNGIYESALQKYDEYMKKLEKLEKEIENADSEKLESYEKMYNDFCEVGASLEKDIKKVYVEVQNISKDYESIIEKSKKDRAKFDKYKAAYSEKKAEIDPKIKTAQKNMEDLKNDIDAGVFEKYIQKRESNIMPVFVQMTDDKCGGCRMEISKARLNAMKNSEFGIIECENCSRYIFVQ